MSDLFDSDDVKNISHEPYSLTACGTKVIPSSGTRCDNKSLNAASIVDPESSHHKPGPTDELGVARKRLVIATHRLSAMTLLVKN